VRTSCEQARERLSLQLDDELSSHEALLLERHLGRCSACAAFAADVSAYTELLRATRLEPAPPFVLLRRPAATRFAARAAAVTAAAAAAVLVAVSTVSLTGSGDRLSAPYGFWPTGLAVQQRGDGNLGVHHQSVALGSRGPAVSAGARRGAVSSA
jgi:predicted anti-sigma-YlaC factor YlaD